MSVEENYRASLKSEVMKALACHQLDFNAILSRLKGAQQQHIEPALEKLIAEGHVKHAGRVYFLVSPPQRPDWERTRARVIRLLRGMPPGNPLVGQWWFNFDSAVQMAQRVWNEHWDGEVAFLGTPVAGFAYAIATNRPCHVMDIDQDVTKVLTSHLADASNHGLKSRATVEVSDAFQSCTATLKGRFDAVICDPPWYDAYVYAFLNSVFELGKPSATVYWSLGPLLTRPEMESERLMFLKALFNCGCQTLALRTAYLSYVVPEFELEAYRHIAGFHSKVWRRSDLLEFRLPADQNSVQLPERPKRPPHISARAFYDKPNHVRVFYIPSRQNPTLEAPFQEDLDFSKTVSVTGYPEDHIALWTSRRQGYKVSSLPSLEIALSQLSQGTELDLLHEKVQSQVPGAEDVTQVVALLRNALVPADQHDAIRRYPELRRLASNTLDGRFAISHSKRFPIVSPDPYRLEFQRDRDKILWSKAFKRLAAKTQVFPHFGDDRFRSRLTHTLEVTQVARTFARAFGVNEDLTEAIALAHDIGHTPFGHAGEGAINEFLTRTFAGSAGAPNRSTWFSHYEHGIDVLRWLEDLYFSPGADRSTGLSVSHQICDGVFKHMYYRYERKDGRRVRQSQEELFRISKHRDILIDSQPSLEAQVVRMADKICYLVEDIEDGILAGVITLDDLLQCRLFSRPFVDLSIGSKESPLHRYLSQRGEIINILMKDVLETTRERLAKLGDSEKARSESDYVVRPSDEIATDISDVWNTIQVQILHRHPTVVSANARASRIIETLLMLFAFCPQLLDRHMSEYFSFLDANTEYLKSYETAVGTDFVSVKREVGTAFAAALAMDAAIKTTQYEYQIPLRNVVHAQDYVASLTDGEAVYLYRTYVQGSTAAH